VTRKLETFERGLVLLTAQSNVSGVLHPYSSLLRHAKFNGWDTLLDAAALLPTSPLDLASHPEIDAIPISWYKIVGQPCFGALLVSNAFYSRLHKPHFAGGTVTRVGNTTVDDFALAEGAERFHDGTIPYSAFPQLYLALEKFNRPRIRQEVALRVRCLIQWLTEGLLTLRWTETNHPLVRVVGFPYLSSDWSRHGATIGLVFYDAAGNRTPFAPIFERLKLFGIDLRSGCMCNTLGILANPGLLNVQSPPCRWLYERTSDTWRLFPLSDCPAEPIAADHGVVRISLGAPSTFEDVYRIYEFAKSLLSYPLGKDDDLVVAKKQVAFKPLQALQRSYLRWLTFDLLQRNGV
jgi:molybdenum cofactor sulfurtransferase